MQDRKDNGDKEREIEREKVVGEERERKKST